MKSKKLRISLIVLYSVFCWLCLIFAIVYLFDNWPSSDQKLEIFTLRRLSGALDLLFCFVIVMLLRGIRWGILIKSKYSQSWIELILVFGWCFLLMAFSPMRMGEFSRILWAKKKNISASWATGIIMAERFIDFFVLIIFLGIVFLLIPGFVPDISRTLITMLLIVMSLFIVFLLISPHVYIKSNKQIEIWKLKLEKSSISKQLVLKLYSFIGGFGWLREFKKSMVILTLTTTIWAVMAYGYYLYFSRFLTLSNWVVCIAIIALVNLSSLIAVVPGNIGVFEAICVLSFKEFGLTSVNLLTPAVGVHFVVILSVLVYGLLCKLLLLKFYAP